MTCIFCGKPYATAGTDRSDESRCFRPVDGHCPPLEPKQPDADYEGFEIPPYRKEVSGE